MAWFNETLFYHIYPIGAFDAPKRNEGEATKGSRILSLIDWIPHLQELGVGALYIGPIFESVSHGYDTNDYFTPDSRLGTKEDFQKVFRCLHDAGIRIVLDGVFNHVGRGFGPYQNVLEKRDASPSRWWFSGLNFGWGNPLGDPCTYNTWGGDWNLVKLELGNPEVRNYLLQAVGTWIDDYDIDGIRLDTADVLHPDFIRDLNHFTKSRKADFWLMGEFMNCANCQMMGPDLLDSITNYECWKGMYSSVNSKNFFEISYGINRQTNPQWGMYRGKYLYNFLDNHDQPRIASQVTDRRTLPALYTMLLTMPGIPSIYYGSEWGMEGRKGQGPEADYDLRRPMTVEAMEAGDQALMAKIAELAAFRKTSKALQYGSYTNVTERNEQLLYARECDGELVLVGFNISEQPFTFEGNTYGRNYRIELAPFESKVVRL
ncbi:MAG: alpha-amylase family glycosyl hydrolase [Lachnospiraceae bacterium]|nr:alpha-amylase family glycosyl hydrolase [Lachnospiraceae bacterium]